MKTFICAGCHKEKAANPRLVKGIQQYCGAPKCQRARKAAWQKNKMATDTEYRADQIESQEKWRKEKPQYQEEYRQNYPDYVEKNREQQRIRNKNRRKQAHPQPDKVIVKMDALNPIITGAYRLTQLKKDAFGKIVKMDTLTVQLEILQDDNQRPFSENP